MAATAWAITKATPSLFPLCCRMRRFPSQPLERRKKFIRGRVAQIMTPSPDRVAAPCPYFGVCGGCDYQHIPYDAQLRYKAEILRETLCAARAHALGRADRAARLAAVRLPQSRAVEDRAAGRATACAAIGYFEAARKSSAPIRECPIVSPRIDETLAALANLLAAGKLRRILREVEAFADDADARLLLNLVLRYAEDASPDRSPTLLRDRAPRHRNAADSRSARRPLRAFRARRTFTIAWASHSYRVGHLSFFQVNRFLLRRAGGAGTGRRARAAGARSFRRRRAFQRAAGATLPARRSRWSPMPRRCATWKPICRRAARPRRPAGEHRGGVSSTRWNETPDLVVLDPPRAGVAARALKRLIKIAPRQIAYLSCDPATLARDLAVAGRATTQNPRPLPDQ